MNRILPNEIIEIIFSYMDIETLYLINTATNGYYKDIIENLKIPEKILLPFLSNLSLTISIQELEFIKMLNLSLILDIIKSNKKFFLRWASKYGHLKLLKYLVEWRDPKDPSKSLTLNDIRSEDNEALRWASENGYLEVVKYLVETKFPTGVKDPCNEGNFVGLTINDIRCRNNEALRRASENGHLEVIDYLIKWRDPLDPSKGLTIDDIRIYNNDALHWASSNGHLEMVKWLVKWRDPKDPSKGLTIFDIRSGDNRALRFASYNGHLEVVKYLVETKFPTGVKDSCNEENFVGLTLDDMKSYNNYRYQFLILNSINGHSEVVKYLISQGLKINI